MDPKVLDDLRADAMEAWEEGDYNAQQLQQVMADLDADEADTDSL